MISVLCCALHLEPMTGLEPVTSSLPRKCSTAELHWHLFLSGKRDSNPRPSAWKADALSTELFPQNIRGRRWIRTTEVVRQQIYSLPHLATLVFALFYFHSHCATTEKRDLALLPNTGGKTFAPASLTGGAIGEKRVQI